MLNYNRRNNNSNGGKRMSLGNLAIILVCAILAGSILLASVGFLSKGFTNTDVGTWFERELNPDNLIKVADYNDGLKKELDNGLKLNWKDNGEIVLSGMVEDKDKTADQFIDYEFVNVTVDGGKVYTLSTGNKNCDKDDFGLYVIWNDATGKEQKEHVGSEALTIDLSEKTEATTIVLYVFCKNQTRYWGLQSYIRPVLVEGETAGEFYK